MELQDNTNNETDASDIGDDSSSSDNNDSNSSDDFYPHECEQGIDSDSDKEPLLKSPSLHSQNRSHDAEIINYMQLPDDYEVLSDDEPFIFAPINADDEKEPKHLQELHQGNKSQNFKDIAECNQKGLRNKNLLCDAKASDLGIRKSTSHEPIKPSLQELSFDDKVKYLKDEFKGIPGPMIRNVLQRDDVQEDLNQAIICLKSISGSEGTSSKAQQREKKVSPKGPKPVKGERKDVSRKDNHQSGFGIENAREEFKASELQRSSNSEGAYSPPSHNNLGSDVHNERSDEQGITLNLEEKVSLLQETFKSIPPLMIKKVLQRSDVEGDLNAARGALESTCLLHSEGTPVTSRQKTMESANKVKKPKPPPVLPKKTKPTKNADNWKRASGIENPGQKIQNAETPRSLVTVKQNQNRQIDHTNCEIIQTKKKNVSSSQKKHNEENISHRDIPKKIQIAQEVTPVKKVPQFEPNTILIRGLNKSTSYDTIKNFAESKTQEQVLEIAKSDDETSAFITFENTMKDFNYAKEKMERHTLEGAKVTVHKVPVSSSILVCNIAPNTTRDALKYYFTNPRNGGEVTSLLYEKGNERAVVTFKVHDVIQKVLSSKLPKLEGAELRVEKINVPIGEKTKKQHSQQEIKVDKDVMECISATDSLSELQESLRVHGFAMTYNLGDSFALIKRVKQSSVDKEKGIQTFTDFTKKFKVMKLDLDKNHWDAVINTISKLHNEIGKDKLLVKECASKDKITIVCREEDSEELKKLFTDKIAETQSFEAMHAHEENTIDDIEKENLRLLRTIGFDKKIKNEYSNIEVNIDVEKGEVTIAGPKKHCLEAKEKIYKEVANFREKQVSVPESVMKTKNFQEVLLQLWKTEKSILTLNIKDSKICVTAVNKKHADEASELVKSLIAEVRIRVKEEDVVKSEDWINFCKKVSQEKKVCVRTEGFEVYIGGIKENVLSAEKRIRKFLVEYSPSIREDKKVVIDGAKADGYHTVSSDKTTTQETSWPESLASGKVNGKEDKDKIGGANMKGAHSEDPAQNTMKFQQPGWRKSGTKVDKQTSNTNPQHRFASEESGNARHPEEIKNLQGNDQSHSANPSKVSSEARPSADSKSVKCGNINISWKLGNIVTEQVSIQVGSTIGKLHDIFIKAGGPDLSKEVIRVMLSNRDDNMILHETGNLPCDQVILVSCCRWDDDKGEAERKLRTIVRYCLQEAVKLKAKSLALPIIGTGGLGFPHDKACQIMIDEVMNEVSFQLGPASLIDIRFVIFDQDEKLLNAFQKEFQTSAVAVLQPVGQEPRFTQDSRPVSAFKGECKPARDKTSTHKPSGDGVVVIEMSTLDSNKKVGLKGGIKLPRMSRPRKSQRMHIPRLPSATKKSAFGGVTVEVYRGNLIDENTDAIVNINAKDMNLQHAGEVSKAIAAAAGPAVQTECNKLGQQAAGSAVVTGAGKLKAKHIIHMIPGEASVQHIQKCIEKCLENADKSKFQSISIPACGTGGFKMSADDSAKATFQALASQCQHLKHLKKIRIVVLVLQMLPAFSSMLLAYQMEFKS